MSYTVKPEHPAHGRRDGGRSPALAGTELTVSPASLTFTSSTWDQAQTVTVTAAEDSDSADDDVTLVHTANGRRLHARLGDHLAKWRCAWTTTKTPTLRPPPNPRITVARRYSL